MGLKLTYHAVERYQQRHDPETPFDACERKLRRLSSHATRTKTKTRAGHEIWQNEDVLFVIKEDAGERIITTVLPASCRKSYGLPDDPQEEMDEMQRLLAESEADRAEMRRMVGR